MHTMVYANAQVCAYTEQNVWVRSMSAWLCPWYVSHSQQITKTWVFLAAKALNWAISVCWRKSPPRLLHMTRNADFASALSNYCAAGGGLRHWTVALCGSFGRSCFFKAPRGFVIAHALFFRCTYYADEVFWVCTWLVRLCAVFGIFWDGFGTATCKFHGSLCIRIVQSFPCKSSRTSYVFLCYIGRLGCSVTIMVHWITQRRAFFLLDVVLYSLQILMLILLFTHVPLCCIILFNLYCHLSCVFLFHVYFKCVHMFSLAHSHVFSHISRMRVRYVHVFRWQIGSVMQCIWICWYHCTVCFCFCQAPANEIPRSIRTFEFHNSFQTFIIRIWHMFFCCGRSCLVWRSFTCPSGGNQVDGLPPAARLSNHFFVRHIFSI